MWFSDSNPPIMQTKRKALEREDERMDFTLIFTKLFVVGLWLAGPLLLSFMLGIIVLGLIVGRKESWSKFDSMYWAFITATTVGYGDIRPMQKVSRVLSVLIAFIGLIFTGMMVALAINAATITFSQIHDLEKVRNNMQQIK